MSLYHVETLTGKTRLHILPWGKGRVYCGRPSGQLRRRYRNLPMCRQCSRGMRKAMDTR